MTWAYRPRARCGRVDSAPHPGRATADVLPMDAAFAPPSRPRVWAVLPVAIFLFASVVSACPACAARDVGQGATRSVLAVLLMMTAPWVVVAVSALALWKWGGRR